MNFLEINFQKKIAKHYHRQKPDNQAQSIHTSTFMHYLLLFFPTENIYFIPIFHAYLSTQHSQRTWRPSAQTQHDECSLPELIDIWLTQSTVEGNCSNNTADPQINWVKNVAKHKYYDFKVVITRTFKWLVKQGNFKAPKAREVHKVKHWFEEYQNSS